MTWISIVRSFTSILVMILTLGVAACKKPPALPHFGRVSSASSDSNADGDEADDNASSMGQVPSEQQTKDILGKILLTSGSSVDQSCKSQSLTSRTSLRLLTRDEYQNSLADILKIKSDYRGMLPTEQMLYGFKNNIDLGKVTDAHAAAYLEAAIQIGDEVFPNIGSLAGCGGTVDEACAQKVIDKLGLKIWRRPLETDEKSKLLTLFKTGAASSPREGMTMMLSSLLISPNFLYRSEIGKSGALTPYELASALSFFLWGTTPDDPLLAAAASGSLATDAGLMAMAQTMFDDPRSRLGNLAFANAWLDTQGVRSVTKDTAIFPDFTQPIRDAMAAEAENTFDYLMRQPGAKFEALFTSDFTLGDTNLAAYYHASTVQEGGVSKIKFTGTSRKGILGFGAILAHLATAKETHPIKRGSFVLKNMFCQYPDPTPANLQVQVPEFDPNLSTRQRFAAHTASPACSGCHKPIDGIGLGMEDFDGAGLFRSLDGSGAKIDSSGQIIGPDGKTSAFNGAGSLSSDIAQSKQARRCFVVEWYRMAHGYPERAEDVCAIRDIANAFEDGSMSLSQLLVKIVTHPTFTKKGN